MQTTNENLNQGALVIGSNNEQYTVHCRGNIELMRSNPEVSKALDNLRDVYSQAVFESLKSGDLEKLKLSKDDNIQMVFTIKNGKSDSYGFL